MIPGDKATGRLEYGTTLNNRDCTFTPVSAYMQQKSMDHGSRDWDWDWDWTTTYTKSGTRAPEARDLRAVGREEDEVRSKAG
jgi:hypothetical protein